MLDGHPRGEPDRAIGIGEKRDQFVDRNRPGRLLHQPLAGVPPDKRIRIGERFH